MHILPEDTILATKVQKSPILTAKSLKNGSQKFSDFHQRAIFQPMNIFNFSFLHLVDIYFLFQVKLVSFR